MPTQGATREKTRIDFREPHHYNVIMHNDDFTSMEFVVEILIDIFHKNEIEAQRLMLMVHEKGKAAVGAYPCHKSAGSGGAGKAGGLSVPFDNRGSVGHGGTI